MSVEVFSFFPIPTWGSQGLWRRIFYFHREGERVGVLSAWRLASWGRRGGGPGAVTMKWIDLSSTPQFSTLYLFPALQTLLEIPEYGSL